MISGSGSVPAGGDAQDGGVEGVSVLGLLRDSGLRQ